MISMEKETLAMVTHALEAVTVTGGSAADCGYLRGALGEHALGLKHELRMVGLGCADALITAKIASAVGITLN